LDSVQLRAEEGDPVNVKAPEILTGNYEEDFEPTAVEESCVTEVL